VDNARLNRKSMSTQIALALGTAFAPYTVMAQELEEEEAMLEEVVVTGIRQSVTAAMEVKRDSDGVVEALMAEDMGKFPDTNLAESMQRITGVSIDRSNAGGPQGEGQRVTVRGIGPDYNLVLLNGRQMPASTIQETTASSSRAFDFSNLASESVAAVEVYKTGRSDIPTGGIGATINILTARPLDMDDRALSLGAKAVFDKSDPTKSWTPEVSGIYSDTFADGKFGVAVSAVYQDRSFGYNQAGVNSGWQRFAGDEVNWGTIPLPGTPGSENITNRPDPGDLYSVPQNILYSLNELERERLNGQLVLQWRPVESFTATLDYTMSEQEIQTKRNDFSAWFNFGPSVSSWTDGPVAAPIMYTEIIDPATSDIGSGGAKYGNKNENDSFGVNLEWNATDRLSFALDYHDSTAESGRASPYGTNSTLGGVGFYRGTTGVDFSQDFPVLLLDTPSGGLDASLMLTGGASFRNSYMKSEVEQTRFSGVFDMTDAMSLDFGVTTTDVNNRSAFSNVQYDDWGGNGSPDDFPDEVWQLRDISSLFDAVSGHDNPAMFDQMFVWDFDTVAGIAEATRGQSMAATDEFSTDRRTNEESLSGYLQWRWAFDIGSMPANLRAGVRYEETDVTSSALVPIATEIRWVGTNEFSVIKGAPDFTELTGSYDYWLPNLDFNVSLTDNFVARASYSKTIGRPGWGDIQGGQTLNDLARINGGTGQQGDPGLLPLESDNYDVSLEWYYNEGSYFSVGYFFKDVANYVGVSTITETPFDLEHPAQGAWYDEANAATGGGNDLVAIRQYIFENYADSQYVEITGTDTNGNFTGYITGQPGDTISTFDIQVPANQKDAEIDGWEIAWQHLFGESGFGLIANYTMVDSDLAYDNASRDDQFAIEGLSDSANLVAFYDKNGWIARLAYNWRDEFLAGRFDGTGLPNPNYVEEYGQFDGIVSYTFDNNVTVFFEGFNLTNEYSRVHGRADLQTLFVTQTGARYGAGIRWTY